LNYFMNLLDRGMLTEHGRRRGQHG
jgi:hypothetical protein